jgi:hypothetical protein
MNYAVKAPNLVRPIGYARSLRFLTANDLDKIEAFYLALDFDNRRQRFGGGQSDEAIVSYCRMIDWTNTIVIGRGSFHLLDAVLEIHPLSSNWDRAEITLTCPLDCDRSRIFAELFQLAAFAAGERGCTKFVVYLNAGCSELVPILHSLGEHTSDGEVLNIDTSGYAITVEQDLTGKDLAALLKRFS